MRKITLLTFLMASFMMFGQTTLWDFEDSNVLPQFQFGNLGFGNIVNPDMTAPNTSMRVLEINKPDAADWFGGIGFETPGLPLINLANGTEFTMDVWAPAVAAGQNIRFQIQNGLSGEPTYNRDVTIVNTEEWVTLTFDFTGQAGLTGMEQYAVLVIQPNYDPSCEGASCTTVGAGNGGLWYVDNIVQIGDVVDPNEDASLSDLTLDGATIAGFSPNTLNYDVELANGTMTAPTVAGVATQAGNGSSNVSVTQAGGVPGTATLDVTAPNGVDMQTYTVNFTEAPALPPAAPTPPAAPAIGIISDAYANINTPQVDVFGGTLTNLDLNTDGNEEARLITGGSGFQFNYFPGSAFVDISEAAMMHFDFYCDNIADGDVLRVRLLGSDTSILNIARATFNASQSGTWVGVDLMIPDGTNRNDFSDIDSSPTSVDVTDIALIQFNTLDLGSTLAGKDVYLSNVYFYGGTLSTPNVDTQEFKVFPNPSSNVWNVRSNTQISNIQLFDILGKQVISIDANSNDVEIDATKLNTGVYFARITAGESTKVVRLVRQ